MRVFAASVAAAFCCLVTTGVAAADSSFTDPAGDAQTAPDVVAVTAANDASGNVTFTVRTNQPALSNDAIVLLALDTDKNAATGGDGVEYLFAIGSSGWQFLRWDGTNFVAANASSANGSYTNGLATFKVSKADMGGISGFNFYVDTVQVDANGAYVAGDTAPDGTSVYTYAHTTPPAAKPLTLRAGAVTYAPKKAVAGKAFAIRVRVTRGDTGAPLTSGKVTCRLTIGGKSVRATGVIRGGVATCSLRLPKTAQKQRLRGTMTVKYNGVTVSKTVSKLI